MSVLVILFSKVFSFFWCQNKDFHQFIRLVLPVCVDVVTITDPRVNTRSIGRIWMTLHNYFNTHFALSFSKLTLMCSSLVLAITKINILSTCNLLIAIYDVLAFRRILDLIYTLKLEAICCCKNSLIKVIQNSNIYDYRYFAIYTRSMPTLILTRTWCNINIFQSLNIARVLLKLGYNKKKYIGTKKLLRIRKKIIILLLTQNNKFYWSSYSSRPFIFYPTFIHTFIFHSDRFNF